MINETIQLNENILNIYRKALYDFENYIEYIYSNNCINVIPYVKHRGYLINLKEFEELKKIIDYQTYKIDIVNYQKQNINIDSSKYEKILTVKQIEYKTSQYLSNMLLNDNQYILINYDLWQLLCEKGKEDDSPILYEIQSKYIILCLENNNEMTFNYELSGKFKNIIDKNFFNLKEIYKPNYDIIIKIYNDINEYYKSETEFSNKIRQKK